MPGSYPHCLSFRSILSLRGKCSRTCCTDERHGAVMHVIKMAYRSSVLETGLSVKLYSSQQTRSYHCACLHRWRKAAGCWRCMQTSSLPPALQTTTILQLWGLKKQLQLSGKSQHFIEAVILMSAGAGLPSHVLHNFLLSVGRLVCKKVPSRLAAAVSCLQRQLTQVQNGSDGADVAHVAGL